MTSVLCWGDISGNYFGNFSHHPHSPPCTINSSRISLSSCFGCRYSRPSQVWITSIRLSSTSWVTSSTQFRSESRLTVLASCVWASASRRRAISSQSDFAIPPLFSKLTLFSRQISIGNNNMQAKLSEQTKKFLKHLQPHQQLYFVSFIQHHFDSKGVVNLVDHGCHEKIRLPIHVQVLDSLTASAAK